MDNPTAKDYIAMARELHTKEGEIEIDMLDETDAMAETRVSRSEDSSGEIGAYVKAWVWVPRESLQPDYEEEERKERTL